MNIAGSYRRGCVNSGDVDLLITSETHSGRALKLVVSELKKIGVIKDVLANGIKKFMGVTKIKSYEHRHLDIVETTIVDYPFALLYFTGSGTFNVAMRKKALSLGYSLNEYDITYKGSKVKVKPEDIKHKIGKYSIKTEEDIFQLLDMEFKLPKDRK